MADTNEVTIRRANLMYGYKVSIDGVDLRHIKEMNVCMKSGSLVEFTVTFMAKLAHAAGIDDPALEGIGHGLHSSTTSTVDVADNHNDQHDQDHDGRR